MHISSKRQRVSPRAAMRSTRWRFELVLSLGIVAISHTGPWPVPWHLYIHHSLLDIRYSMPHGDAQQTHDTPHTLKPTKFGLFTSPSLARSPNHHRQCDCPRHKDQEQFRPAKMAFQPRAPQATTEKKITTLGERGMQPTDLVDVSM